MWHQSVLLSAVFTEHVLFRSVPFCSANSAHIHYPKVLLPTAFSPYFHITVVRLRQAGWHIQCSVCTFVWEFPVGLVPTGTPQCKVYEPAGYSGLHRDANGVKTAWKPKSQEPSEELAEETEEKKKQTTKNAWAAKTESVSGTENLLRTMSYSSEQSCSIIHSLWARNSDQELELEQTGFGVLVFTFYPSVFCCCWLCGSGRLRDFP